MAARVTPNTPNNAKINPRTSPPPRRPAPRREVVRDNRSPRRPAASVIKGSFRIFGAALSIEDKLAQLLFRIMSRLDEQIGKQIDKVDRLQNNTKSAKGEKLTKLNTSIDQESFKLKRLTEKRKQLFDLLVNSIGTYDRTAQNAIAAIKN